VILVVLKFLAILGVYVLLLERERRKSCPARRLKARLSRDHDTTASRDRYSERAS